MKTTVYIRNSRSRKRSRYYASLAKNPAAVNPVERYFVPGKKWTTFMSQRGYFSKKSTLIAALEEIDCDIVDQTSNK